MVRVELPAHLRTLAGVSGREVLVEVDGVVCVGAVLDAVEARWPMLRGTIREYGSGERRAFLRFFADGEDWSHMATGTRLPEAVVEGRMALLVIGAVAGG